MKIQNKIRALRIALSCVLCLTLLCSLLQLSTVGATETKESGVYFGLAMLSLCVHELLLFFYMRQTKPHRLDYMQFGYMAIALAAMVCAFAIRVTSELFVVAPALYLLIPLAKRVVYIARKSKVRTKVYHILVLIVCILFELVTFAIWGAIHLETGSDIGFATIPLFACSALMLSCLVNICAMVFSQFNRDIFLRIVHKTYAGEILLGLLLLVVAFSLVLMHNEESIHGFGDALWYCFAVITTIGFGDIAAKSMVGRILTVILGMYGIVVVSILTSIIVNFYSEVKGNKDDDETDGAVAASDVEGLPTDTAQPAEQESSDDAPPDEAPAEPIEP